MKILKRQTGKRWIAGICSGFGETYNVDPIFVRLVVFTLTLFSGGLFLLTYLLAWLITPTPTSKPIVSRLFTAPALPQENAGQSPPAVSADHSS